jgi:acetylornithine/N-succinyldiaminopimelate aminotransferase
MPARSKRNARRRAGAGVKPNVKVSLEERDPRIAEADEFLLSTYRRPPVLFTHGRGAYVYDSTGKEYLDFLGGIAVNALGHAHPRIVKTIRREAARAIHLSNLFHNAYQGPLARKLAEWSGLSRVFFANSGTEAVDGALKLARLHARTDQDPVGATPKKYRVLAMHNSFHGRTFGALSVTSTEKYRLPFAPVVPGVEFVRLNDVADLESKFDDSIAAVIVETIQGEGGIHPVSEAFWNRLRDLTTEHGALLIADEIQCGLGRVGRRFAYENYRTKPDVVVIAKPLAGGLPLGAILVSEAVSRKVSPGVHGTTFGGGPLACATALEFLNIVEEEKLFENCRLRGAQIREGLAAIAAKFAFVREIRGEGLMIGVELSIDGAPLVLEALHRGLLINCTHDHTLRLLPPFNVTKTQIKDFLRLLEQVFSAVQPEFRSTAAGHHSPQAASAAR